MAAQLASRSPLSSLAHRPSACLPSSSCSVARSPARLGCALLSLTGGARPTYQAFLQPLAEKVDGEPTTSAA
ncbi:hypothetical protein E2562_018689 [Oryza meyeriana var. granulata]|uniref:Uncharacterized protein n=1 Tax=Oryza meyeriana var. granulata TaxID=110450 RepID=A0A6G1EMR4_9ORYZ|nr:hypothetical protein E2562_018689 [Oryza meyeriana var. granulata]